MKIYMDPHETAIINLEEVKKVTKCVNTITLWFKDGTFKTFEYADYKQRDDELRVIFHEMHD